MPRQPKEPNNSSTFKDICPACGGSGKLRTEHKKKKTTDDPTPCEMCNGTGLVPIIQKPRKRL